MTTSWDEVKALEVKEYIEQMTRKPFPNPAPTPEDFHISLKNGVLLCELINAIKPGTISVINTKSMPFLQMENIGKYIKACSDLGVPSEYNFMTVDLYEGKNINQVVLNVINLKRHVGHGFEKAGKEVPLPKMVSIKGDDQTVSSPSQHNEQPVPVGGPSKFGVAYKAGISPPTPATDCCVCNKTITAAILNACDKTWHAKCFTCKKCGTALQMAKYYEDGKKPYCEKCIYQIKSSPAPMGAKTKDMGFGFGKS